MMTARAIFAVAFFAGVMIFLTALTTAVGWCR